MSKTRVQCNNCEFLGTEDNLEKVVVFREQKNSDLLYSSLNNFYKIYGDFNNVHEYEIINGCPNCQTDEYLMDVSEA